MPNSSKGLGAPEWLILTGAIFFIIVLTVSAIWEADIRWLHFFQAWMYVATIVLSLRGSRWGHFIGIAAAGLWDHANVVATSFLRNGLQQLSGWIHTGHLARPDLLIAVPAWGSNLLVVIGCLWAYGRSSNKSPRDVIQFVVVFAVTTGFFAGAIALFQPRYLTTFPRLLHPHLF